MSDDRTRSEIIKIVTETVTESLRKIVPLLSPRSRWRVPVHGRVLWARRILDMR